VDTDGSQTARDFQDNALKLSLAGIVQAFTCSLVKIILPSRSMLHGICYLTTQSVSTPYSADDMKINEYGAVDGK
jgi:hypothetical protein